MKQDLARACQLREHLCPHLRKLTTVHDTIRRVQSQYLLCDVIQHHAEQNA